MVAIFRFILLFFLLAGTLFLIGIHLLNQTSLYLPHIDEVYFLERAKFADWYTFGSFSREEWQSFESYDVPKFAELFYGFVIKLYTKETVLNYLINTNYLDKDTLLSNVHKMSGISHLCCSYQNLPQDAKDLIKIHIFLRNVVVFVFIIPLLVIIFLIGYETKSYFFGFVSMVLIGTNSLFLLSMVKAIGDAPLWFFSFLFLLVTMYYSNFYIARFEEKKKNIFFPTLGFLTVLGVLAGLAVSTKLNGVLILFFFSFYTFYRYLSGKIKPITVLFHIIFVTFIAYCIFFVLNPFLWSNPILKTKYMAEHRLNTMEQHKIDFPNQQLMSFTDRITSVYDFTISAESDFVFFKLNNLNNQRYNFPFDLVVIITSVVILLINRKRNSESFKILIIFIITILVISTIFLPVEWDRYYLPYTFSWGFLQAYALTYFIEKILWSPKGF